MTVTVVSRRGAGTLAPPPRRFYAQRAPRGGALAGGTSLLHNIGCCDDTLARSAASRRRPPATERLGAAKTSRCTWRPASPRPARCTVGGSASRHGSTPVAALCDRPVRTEGGGARCSARPMGRCFDALPTAGRPDRSPPATVLPIEVRVPLRGRRDRDSTARSSSQFHHGLLLVLPAGGPPTRSPAHSAMPISTPYFD